MMVAEGEIIIHVTNEQAQVAQRSIPKGGGPVVYQPAKNWEALRDAATDEVAAAGGNGEDGDWPCSDALRQRAAWSTSGDLSWQYEYAVAKPGFRAGLHDLAAWIKDHPPVRGVPLPLPEDLELGDKRVPSGPQHLQGYPVLFTDRARQPICCGRIRVANREPISRQMAERICDDVEHGLIRLHLSFHNEESTGLAQIVEVVLMAEPFTPEPRRE